MTTQEEITQIADRLGVVPDELIAAIVDVTNGHLSVTALIHGTAARYKAGCRCEGCRRRFLETRRRWSKQKSQMDRAEIPHGTHHAYSTYGCRCDECREANSRLAQPARAARQRQTVQSAHRNGYQWTGPELETASRADLSAREVALLLGRTMAAVENIRRKLKDDPKTILVAGLPKDVAS